MLEIQPTKFDGSANPSGAQHYYRGILSPLSPGTLHAAWSTRAKRQCTMLTLLLHLLRSVTAIFGLQAWLTPITSPSTV